MKNKLVILVVILFASWGLFTLTHNQDADPINSTTLGTKSKPKNSLTEPSSLWVVTNKRRPLPATFVPSDLVVPNVDLMLDKSYEQMKVNQRSSDPLKQMIDAAKSQNIHLYLASGYRSAAYQKQLYDGYVRTKGQAYADSTSARPGTSEHQTGLAVDLDTKDGNCQLEQCFGDSVGGKWLAENSYKYGFILRYTKTKESVTGYAYEPWHFRYVGTDLSTQMHNKKIETLEEYFKLGAAPDYGQ